MNNNQIQLILCLLKHSTSCNTIRLESVESALRISPASLNRALDELAASRFIQLNGSSVEVTAEQRLALALKLLEARTDPERIARVLKWQEFEDLVQHFLQMNSYETIKHLVMGSRKTRLELDLVAFHRPFIVCVDCKHWRRGLANSALRKAATKQKARALRLAGSISKSQLAMRVTDWSLAYVVAALVTLGDSCPRNFEGVPAVSLIRFNDFLCELGPYSNSIEVIPAKPGP